MTTTDPDLLRHDLSDPLDEARLLQAVREGSTGAFGILYTRYRPFAVTVAQRSLSRSGGASAEDVAEVAFIRVLTALRNGKGPTDTLRAYLATTVRREVWRAERRVRRQADVVDRWASDEDRGGEPSREPVAADVHELNRHALLGEAFRGLSDRWRNVLWLTEVEGRRPAEVAPLLGLTPGSASALAYRARNGLITAYVAAYGRSTTDPACRAIAPRLGKYLAAGSPATDYADVRRHLDGCRSCRDVLRGVDLLGSSVAAFAPFGILTAGLWAKGAGSGAGSAAVAVGATGRGGRLGRASARAGVGGVGLAVGLAVAACAAAIVGGAAWLGTARSSSERTASSPRPGAPAAPPEDQGAGVPVTVSRTAVPSTTAPAVPSTAPSTTTASKTATPSTTTTVPPSPTVPAGPPALRTPSTTVPAPVVPSTSVTTTTAAATTSTAAPTTSTTSTTTPTSSTTTTEVPPEPAGQLSGRAVRTDLVDGNGARPVAGIDVVAYDVLGRVAGTATTGADGRWRLDGLEPGPYAVVAVVPAAYRPADGLDPWLGGPTWSTTLGLITLGDGSLDLVDLRLLPR